MWSDRARFYVDEKIRWFTEMCNRAARAKMEEDRQGAVLMELVKLSDISADNDLQPRALITSDVVDEYAEAMRRGESFPPVTLFKDGTTYWLADGYHRYRAAKQAGLERVSAEFRTGTKEDALKFALSANAIHGLRRSQADKRRVVLIALEKFGDLSNREIGRLVKVDDKTIAKYRERVDIAADVIKRIDNGESVYAKHGEDRLFIFRLPDDPGRPGLHYAKLIFICHDFVCWDSRGFNTKYIKCAIYCSTCDDGDALKGVKPDFKRFHAANHLDMIDFDSWESISADCLPDILEIAIGAGGS
jgi:hypothetical protein